jgi:hypothetical protein
LFFFFFFFLIFLIFITFMMLTNKFQRGRNFFDFDGKLSCVFAKLLFEQ